MGRVVKSSLSFESIHIRGEHESQNERLTTIDSALVVKSFLRSLTSLERHLEQRCVSSEQTHIVIVTAS